LGDDYAADNAVRQVVRECLFRREKRYRFLVNRYADTLDDFRTWLEQFTVQKPCQPDPALVTDAERIMSAQPPGTAIVLRGRLVLTRLRKL
jgi:hypothetical protein